MNIDTRNKPINKIRRSDRAKDDAWIRGFLHRAPIGVIATARDDQPFLVSRNFSYDEERHAIYIHGAKKGRTYENVRENPRVCFSVSEMGRLLPADEAIEFGVEYAGAVVFGRAALVEDPSEAAYGLQLLMDKYFHHLKSGVDYAPIVPEAMKVTAVFRIDIESWSGKEKKVADDFPGAFYFQDPKRSE
jgi:nitroimidazol reductase NimA-like FMN-containing flavoprotein (pyridoxamine 5'-phosphate oxidase superfamily)